MNNGLTPEDISELIRLAREARQRAYAPYSNYAVGAALRASSGRIYMGANVENAAYPQTMCAERVAVFTAVAAGEREFDAIAVVTQNGGTPCGGCRQVLAEFGLGTRVIIADAQGGIVQQATAGELLPAAFDSAKLRGA